MASEAGARPGRIIGEAGQRQVQLPLSKAFWIAVQNIRVRFWRSMITAAGVLLGIAFLSATLGQSTITAHTPLQFAVNEALAKAQQIEAHARQIWLVSMSLIVCTVGIANSMLMSVTERFKEIGTMKCLGALDGFIVKLFLLEAGVLGLTASVLGWAIGYGGVVFINLLRDGYKLWPKLPLLDVVQHFGMCLATGMVLTILATIAPAIRASRLPPAAALRVEV
ncbi:MAG: ABC transporter permease [Armatimonadetes bacterium]|nr:ABC transporter permease [Armatimonadota bacterium]